MPPGSVDAVITGIAVTTMLRALVLFPAAFVALTVKLNVPAVVGVPDITPVDAFKLRPAGNVRAEISQVIGAVPVAASLWLYD